MLPRKMIQNQLLKNLPSVLPVLLLFSKNKVNHNTHPVMMGTFHSCVLVPKIMLLGKLKFHD